MADRPVYPDAKGDTGDDAREGPMRSSAASYPGTPRWVKVSGIVALVLVLVVVIGLVTGHAGPGRHLPSSGAVATPRP